tara:strand:- start:170 stop:634 length:465 start_codon:yes stop_codon:yes gene_type:complete
MGLKVLSVAPAERSSVYNITSDTTLTKIKHDGAIIVVNHLTGVSAIDLPAAADAEGMKVTIIVGVTVTSDFHIDGQGTSAIRMHAVADDGAEATNTVWGVNRYIVYDESEGSGLGGAANGIIGDICELVCTGGFWVAKCFSRTGTWISDSDGTI